MNFLKADCKYSIFTVENFIYEQKNKSWLVLTKIHITFFFFFNCNLEGLYCLGLGGLDIFKDFVKLLKLPIEPDVIYMIY